MDEIERAIDVLAKKVTPAVQPDQALKFTQAALNLAHVKALLEGMDEARKANKTKGAGS